MVISAGYDAQLNEMSHVWQALSDRWGAAVQVIAPRHDKLKAHHAVQAQAQHGEVRIAWLEQAFPLRMNAEIDSLTRAFKPDVVFAGPRDHLAVAVAVGQVAQAPVMLHTEYFYDDQRWLRRREYLGWPTLRARVAQRVRMQTMAQTHTVCISDPQERPQYQPGDKVAYLPWPHLHQTTVSPQASRERDLQTLVYIGFLFRAKGAECLGWGQIGDAWMAGMPVIAAREHYDLRANDNCLIAPTAQAFVAAVRRLRVDESERVRLAEGGHRSVAAHAVDKVASTLHQLLTRAAQPHVEEALYG